MCGSHDCRLSNSKNPGRIARLPVSLECCLASLTQFSFTTSFQYGTNGPLRMFCRLYASEPGYITPTSIFTHNKISHNQSQDQKSVTRKKRKERTEWFRFALIFTRTQGLTWTGGNGVYPQRNQHLVIGWAGIICTYNRPTFYKWTFITKKNVNSVMKSSIGGVIEDDLELLNVLSVRHL